MGEGEGTEAGGAGSLLMAFCPKSLTSLQSTTIPAPKEGCDVGTCYS